MILPKACTWLWSAFQILLSKCLRGQRLVFIRLTSLHWGDSTAEMGVLGVTRILDPSLTACVEGEG